MTPAELPQQSPRQIAHNLDDVGVEPDLELPESLNPWVAALLLWPCVDPSCFRLVSLCYGRERVPEWTFLASLLVHAGLVIPAEEPDTYSFREEWQPALERGLADLGGVDAVRSRLIDTWLEAPDPLVVVELVGWASDLARWDAVDKIWMTLTEQPGAPPAKALAIFRDLPLEARKARPMLTYASGAAGSLLASPSRQAGEATLKRLLLDSELLHADWSVRDNTDVAVAAGTIRMIGQRRLPTTQPGQSLEAAWRTKQEIDTLIDTRSRAGNGPGRTSHAVFRAFSARLALFRGDPQRAVSEAQWAALLSDWDPASALAAGAEALARSVSSDDSPAFGSSPPLEGPEDPIGGRGFRGMGHVFQLHADGYDALRRLDREGLDEILAAITPQAAAVAGVWSLRSTLVAHRAALWGDASAGADQLAADIAHQAIFGREHEEPLGSALLARARVQLLTKMGAFGAAIQAAANLTGDLQVLPTARVHLWAGQFERAIRTADSARYHDELDLADRYRLALLKTAAALLSGTCDEELREEGLRELRYMVPIEAFLPIALLPSQAREVLVELYRSETGPDDTSLQLLIGRLGELNDAGSGGVRRVRLTEREGVLLPLLAGDDSVPEIARKLHVSVNTVRKQVVTLREKFGANTRSELIQKARSYGSLG